MRIVSASFLAMLTLAAVGGCSKEKAPPLTPASGKTVTSSDAIDALATAQCNHEQTCGRIGPEEKYSSREHCMNQKKSDLRRDLTDCKKKIDDNDVRQCIGAIEGQGCSNVIDELESFMACKTDDLCD